MTDFERFISVNRLKKKDIAAYLGVSSAFITQLTSGLRQIPDEKFALIKAKTDWDTTMFDKTETSEESEIVYSDFSKIADACQKAANAAEESAKTNRILVENNSTLVESNNKLINQLFESLARLEKKIDLRGVAADAESVVSRAAQK